MEDFTKKITLDSFPFETKEFSVVQTHISYVFITPVFVYKIKKPVNFGFLDFSTLEKRKFFCEKEIVLNKRLAPEIYLEVVSITKDNGIYKIEGKKGEIIEYAVKMKPLPLNGLMSKILKEKKLTSSHILLLLCEPAYKKEQAFPQSNLYEKK